MTTREVAARLGVSTVRVRQLARMGRLPDLRRGRACLYRPQDIEAFARIPRPTGIRRAPGRKAGGAPRGNFNHLTTSGRQGRLHAVRRHLPPPSRAIFDAAVVAAQHVEGATPHQRHRARLRAVALVVLATARAHARPAKTAAGQHRHLVVALKPWLELIP